MSVKASSDDLVYTFIYIYIWFIHLLRAPNGVGYGFNRVRLLVCLPVTASQNKTDVERRQTLSHLRSINPNMINHVPQQSPLIFEVIYVVCTRSNKNFVFVSSPMSRFKQLSKVRCQQPHVCWHGSGAFPILPIHIANLSWLSKCTLPIISILKSLKLSNSQTSYPIWQMSILMLAWRVSDNQV